MIAAYRHDDTGMRNITVITLTELGFTGRRVAEVMGLTPEYISMLRTRARKEGSAGLVRTRGRRPKLSPAQVRRAQAWRTEGLSDAEIARRLHVSDKTAARVLIDTPTTPHQPPPGPADELDLTDTADDGPEPVCDPQPEPACESEPAGPATGTARITTGSLTSRYAGATLLHAFTDRVGATDILTTAITAATSPQRFDDLALLTATTTVFALGYASVEQAKHPDRAQIGPVAGITALPTVRTLRPRLAAIADTLDPLGLQRAFATAMLHADPNTSGIFFVDDHFVPYAGKLPVGKGWNTKRRHAERGRADTLICDPTGRAICFTTSEPSGLATTLPGALAELRAVTGPDATLMLGFDRGGAYPSVFTTCRDAGVDWITYRRGHLAPTRHLPMITTVVGDHTTTNLAIADELVTINDYGTARQITLFEHGHPVWQILTSDHTSCASALIRFLRARWRIENLFKYLDFYGIDALADYTATIEANTRPVDNPARLAARAHLKALTSERDNLRGALGAVLTDRTLTITALNRESTTTQNKINKVERAITTAQNKLRTIPAKLPANQVDPNAQRAIHRVARRALQMVLRLLAANAEHWLAHQLNIYLQDPDEYRTTTRNLFHLGGTITYTPQAITVTLDRPNTPKVGRALALLIEQLNINPPRMPGDARPITYSITP